MTSLLESVISVIAPHQCFSCGKEGNVLCSGCHADTFSEPCEVCFLCNAPTTDGKVCRSCSTLTSVGNVWMVGAYDGICRRLVRAYKFERLRAAHVPLAQAMLEALPYLEDVVVVPVPTAPSRVRVRGYDHAQLLARYIVRERGWGYVPALRRRTNDRQVGSTRAARFRQAEQAYELASKSVHGRHVLLVDDVTTSGATLQAAGRILSDAGTASINAVVAAKHTLQ